MPPKGDKKEQLWEGIRIQKLQQVRHGLANSGILPSSRNAEGHTTFQVLYLIALVVVDLI
jgi:hypothetical protein